MTSCVPAALGALLTCLSVPRDLPAGGEEQRPPKLPAHLQCHQRDTHQHGGSGVDQLVLSRVIYLRNQCGDMLYLVQTQDDFRIQSPVCGARKKPCGVGERSLDLGVESGLGGGGRRTYFFTSHWQYLVFLLTGLCGHWWLQFSFILLQYCIKAGDRKVSATSGAHAAALEQVGDRAGKILEIFFLWHIQAEYRTIFVSSF